MGKLEKHWNYDGSRAAQAEPAQQVLCMRGPILEDLFSWGCSGSYGTDSLVIVGGPSVFSQSCSLDSHILKYLFLFLLCVCLENFYVLFLHR